MTISALIERLKKLDPANDIKVVFDGIGYDIDDIDNDIGLTLIYVEED